MHRISSYWAPTPCMCVAQLNAEEKRKLFVPNARGTRKMGRSIESPIHTNKRGFKKRRKLPFICSSANHRYAGLTFMVWAMHIWHNQKTWHSVFFSISTPPFCVSLSCFASHQYLLKQNVTHTNAQQVIKAHKVIIFTKCHFQNENPKIRDKAATDFNRVEYCIHQYHSSLFVGPPFVALSLFASLPTIPTRISTF